MAPYKARMPADGLFKVKLFIFFGYRNCNVVANRWPPVDKSLKPRKIYMYRYQLSPIDIYRQERLKMYPKFIRIYR
jgi:hypothetical protein